MIANFAYEASVWVVPVLIAVTFHEAAHGYVAWKLGDDTARRMGRVSFNPFRHVDSFGTVVLPALLLLLSGGRIVFGYARPVPVDFSRFDHPRRDMILVAAAGPAANLALAFVSALLLHVIEPFPREMGAWLEETLLRSLLLNLVPPSSTCCPCRRSTAGGSRSACCRAPWPCRSPDWSAGACRF